MKTEVEQHLISATTQVRTALARLDRLAADAVLFLVDEQGRLLSSLTDGDIRRGLLRGLDLDAPLSSFTQPYPKFFHYKAIDIAVMRQWRADNYRIIPVVDDQQRVIDVINFRKQKSYLPLDAVIMAGGRGTRLRPLTDEVPKPMLKVGDRPILEHNVARLGTFGIQQITISINYLGEQIVEHFKQGEDWGVSIDYLTEETPRGTIGAVRNIAKVRNDHVLVMNSDLLTTIDFEQMFATLQAEAADMIVATIPYEVKIPYGVIESEGDLITALREKPTYTYYANAGIYMFRREHIARIPASGAYGAPDLMADLYENGLRVVQYPILNYWLDIGKYADFEKAQSDIKHLQL